MTPIPFIDLKTQYEALKGDIQARIQGVLDHGQFIMGPEVAESEELLAKFVGSRHAITCSSGTDATVLAMMALGIGPGDEVILPAFSFIATAETVILVGATPVYIDIDPLTYNLDPKKIEEAVTSKTKAILPVSLYGQPAEMDEINAIAKKHNLYVIEDAAQSFGSSYKGKRSCNLSLIGCTSFFPAKPLGVYGDGGAIFTNDDELAKVLKQIRFHGQQERYYHVRIGMNGRMDTLQCAILIPKLKRLPWELEQREKWAQKYNERLMPLQKNGLVLPLIASDRQSCWAQYTLRVKDRSQFQAKLNDLGVPTSVHYPRTMPDQPAYTKIGRIHDIRESQRAAEEVISLPMYPDMNEQIFDRICSAVEKSV